MKVLSCRVLWLMCVIMVLLRLDSGDEYNIDDNNGALDKNVESDV